MSEQRLARYCRPIDSGFIQRLEARRPKTMQEVSDAWYGYRNTSPQRYDSSRYHGLNLNSLFFRGTIELRYFNGTLHAGEVKAYLQLALAMAAKALSSKAASSKRRDFNAATAKYDFRVFLLKLGLIGDEFKPARLNLMAKLEGSAAPLAAKDPRIASARVSSGPKGAELTVQFKDGVPPFAVRAKGSDLQIAIGRAEVDTDYDSGMVRFFVNKDAPGNMRVKLVEVVKRIPYQKVEINVDPAIEEEPEETEGEEAPGGATATAPPVDSAPPPPPPAASPCSEAAAASAAA